MIANPTLKTVGTQRKGSERKLVKFLHVLTKIHKLLQTNSYRTKRELFYEDVGLFKTQKTLDDILDDIACLLQTPKIKLHVLTTSKGCISGNLRYKESDGSYIDCSESNQGVLISNDVDSISYIQSDARFILVVEKSAVFQMLLDCNITKLLYPCILITGKGFPDVNTREMLRKLWNCLKIPVLGLMDADPYGIEILSIYKYGSKAMSFDVEKLAVPELRWLGLLPSDIQRLQFPKSATIPLTDNDKLKITKLLQRPYIRNNVQFQNQIQILQEKAIKAEIEGLNKISDNFLSNIYLPNKIRYGGWI
ncbi:meiotic recombination protein SPO11-like [Argiope bruennichi]|uniref:meiotic recombination protein SPO11-like n=1 Tax=Argiope bruennichi TaxID=94029 RepID=UPI002493D836|nr:meiotic recombination protein SPO11-like [Argiope bruennichi]